MIRTKPKKRDMDSLQTKQMVLLLQRLKTHVRAYNGSSISVESKSIEELLKYCHPDDRKDFKVEIENIVNPKK